MIGAAIFIIGLAWGLVVMHVGHTYIAIAVLILLGLCVMGAVGRTRTKDVSN
jgi:hypothetical protein